MREYKRPGRRLLEYRRRNKISLRRLAAIIREQSGISVSYSTLSRIERGGAISDRALRAMAGVTQIEEDIK